MREETGSIFRTVKYKDCAIRAASYQVGLREWIPEACLWKYMERGWSRFWVKSFEHLFVGQRLTFSSQKDADSFAFRLARMLLDEIQADLEKKAPKFSLGTYLMKSLRGSWRPLSG